MSYLRAVARLLHLSVHPSIYPSLSIPLLPSLPPSLHPSISPQHLLSTCLMGGSVFGTRIWVMMHTRLFSSPLSVSASGTMPKLVVGKEMFTEWMNWWLVTAYSSDAVKWLLTWVSSGARLAPWGRFSLLGMPSVLPLLIRCVQG